MEKSGALSRARHLLPSWSPSRSGAGITIYHLSFVFAFPILLVVFADPGTGMNQLLDVCALTVIVAGGVWVRATP